MLPRVHGSAVFQRGETQALVTVTLGTTRDEQRVDGLIDEYSKKFMLDYNFPSFSVGEVQPDPRPRPPRNRPRRPGRAERQARCCPTPKNSPTRSASSPTFSNRTALESMASVCGATLGLMAAGVPISNPVAGISVGLVKESDSQWVLLTDIIGDEDHFGDMDFKIAGTQNGITGIQLDLKIDGISAEIIRATLEQSREARIEILRQDADRRSRGRRTTFRSAPRGCSARRSIREKIGLLIGPGGKNIRGIQEATGTVIEVEDDGTVTIASTQPRMGRSGPGPGRSLHRDGADRQDLRRPRHQHQGLRRVRRNPARPRRPVPHQRTVRRLRQLASATSAASATR